MKKFIAFAVFCTSIAAVHVNACNADTNNNSQQTQSVSQSVHDWIVYDSNSAPEKALEGLFRWMHENPHSAMWASLLATGLTVTALSELSKVECCKTKVEKLQKWCRENQGLSSATALGLMGLSLPVCLKIIFIAERARRR